LRLNWRSTNSLEPVFSFEPRMVCTKCLMIGAEVWESDGKSYGLVRNLPLQREHFWADRIVPFAVEVMAAGVDGFEFGVGHLDAGRVRVWVKLATNLQAGLGGGCGDQFDDDLMADQRL
jgi:hypothetical protein